MVSTKPAQNEGLVPRQATSPRLTRIPNPESRIPNPESRIPNPESLDNELPERHAQVPALAGAGQCQRDLALGHDLGLARLHRAGVGLGGDIGAQRVGDAVDAGELAHAILDL